MTSRAPDNTARFLVKVIFIDGTTEQIKLETLHDDIDSDYIYGLKLPIEKQCGKTVAKLTVINRDLNRQIGFVNFGPNKSNDEETAVTAPPVFAEFICALFVVKRHRDGIIGDFADDYAKNLKKFSKRRADLLYWAAVARAVWPLAKRLLGRVAWAGVGTALLRWLSS